MGGRDHEADVTTGKMVHLPVGVTQQTLEVSNGLYKCYIYKKNSYIEETLKIILKVVVLRATNPELKLCDKTLQKYNL